LHAKSKADAVGVWQFLEKSALEYLIIDRDHDIDERTSPIKSTYAAAKMFLRNYHLLRDYGLAVIAYNHGPKNLVRYRDRVNSKNIGKFLHSKHSPLGFASRNYYSEFLALLHAERYRDELFGIALQTKSGVVSIVRMKHPISIFEIATLYNISLHELRLFNPDIFDAKRKLPAGTRVVIPRKVGESLVEAPQFQNQNTGPNRGIASEVEFIEYVQ